MRLNGDGRENENEKGERNESMRVEMGVEGNEKDTLMSAYGGVGKEAGSRNEGGGRGFNRRRKRV